MMRRIIRIARSFFLNLFYFKTLSKRVIFGSHVNLEGLVQLSNRIVLDDNVEVRNLTKEILIIESNVSINRNTVIRGKVHIGKDCAIAPNCMIIGTNHRFNDIKINIKEQGNITKGIDIESNVWIGANSVVLDGVRIGTGSVIGAGSVVTKDIPPYSIAVGNPCKVIKSRLNYGTETTSR